jgi:hypothetical protein
MSLSLGSDVIANVVNTSTGGVASERSFLRLVDFGITLLRQPLGMTAALKTRSRSLVKHARRIAVRR